MRFQSGITDQYIYFVAVDATDLTTRKTALSGFTVYRSRNGGVATVFTTPTINETDVTNMPGVYELLLDEDMTIDAGDDSQAVVLHITVATMAPVTLAYELYRPTVTAGSTLDVTATGAAGVDWGNVENKTTSNALTATSIITTQQVDVNTIKTNPVVNAGTVTFPTTATLASTTNITAGTITTTTNLTNLPAITANWLTAAGTAADFTTEIQAGLATSAALATVQADTDNIQTRLPTALTANGLMMVDSLYENGTIWMDTAGAAGAVNFVNGTMLNPLSSIANARTIANSLNLKNFYVNNNTTITLDQGYNGFSFFGEKWTLALANRLIDNSFFSGATVSGLSTGTGWAFEHCTVGTVTLAAPGILRNCGLTGTYTIGAAGLLSIQDCTSEVAAGAEWTLAFAAVGATTVGLRRYAGRVTVTGMAAGDVLIFSGHGALTIDATCTAGTVYIRGAIELTNNGSGQTIVDSSRWNEDQTLPAIWDVDATTHQTQGTFGQAIGDPVADANTIYKATVSDATGATVGVDVVALKAETAAIKVDTAAILIDTTEIGVAGAGLTNIDLPNQTMDITGNLSGSVGSVTGSVGSVVGLTVANLDTTVSSRATPAQVNAEVLDVFNVDTFAEPGQEAPATTTTFRKMLTYLYKAWKNKTTQTATEYNLYDSVGVFVDQKSTFADDGTTATKNEIVSGP